jgi:Ice-binding-like
MNNITMRTAQFCIMISVFLTATFAADTQPSAPVDLRTSGNFAILSKTGISGTGTTAIIGDIGVSPAAATYITGFSLILDPLNLFSTSALVTGKIYAADYIDPTPTILTTAISDMETAYTDAAGRTSPDFTELYSGDLTGRTLGPGLYKWSTGVTVSAAGVTLSGASSDVWIFQIAQNISLASGAMVTLSGGAKVSNIFWQVAGQATLGTTSAMKGTILCQTAIVMNTGATLTGRALAQTAVTLDANTVIGPTSPTALTQGRAFQKNALDLNYADKSFAFTVPSNGHATLRIFNARGQAVALLFSGEAQAGKYNRSSFSMNGKAKGLYMAILEYNGTIKVKKIGMVL